MNPLGVHALVFASGWTEPDGERAIAGAQRHGFEMLEIPLHDPARIDVPRTRRLLDHAGLRPVTSIGLGFASDISSGDPENVARGEARLNLALSVARDLGAKLLTGVLYSAQGRYREPPTEAGRWNCVRVLGRLAERAAQAGITLGIEAVNRYESNLVNTAGQALALIDQVGAANLVVHLDSYHMNLEEGDPAGAIERCGARLGYVQIGESHRGYLGSGTIDFGPLFRALAKIGYQGPITFEALSARWRSGPVRGARGLAADLDRQRRPRPPRPALHRGRSGKRRRIGLPEHSNGIRSGSMTMALKPHLIGGQWVESSEAADDINPSDLKDVVGEYARADRATAERAIAAAKAAFPAWARSTPQQRFDALDKVGNEILARQEELGELLSREEGKTLPEGIGEAARAGPDLQVLRRRGAAPRRRAAALGPARDRGRDHPRARGRRRADHALELPDRDPGLEDRAGAGLRQLRGVQARRPGAGLRLGAGRDHQARRAPRTACSTWSWAAARWSARRCSRSPDVAAISFTGSVDTGRHIAAKCAAGMRSSSSRWAARTRWSCSTTPTSRPPSALRGQGRLLLDRPALHGDLAPDRDRGHPRPVRDGDGRAAEGAEGRRRAEARHPDRPGGRPEPARPGHLLHRDRPEGGRQARGRRRAPEARHRGLLSAAGPVHRDRQPDADQSRGDLRPGRDGDPGQGLRRGAGGRQRHAVRALGRHLHELAQACEPLQAQSRGRHGDGQPADRRASTTTCRSAAGRARATARASRGATRSSSTPRSRPPTPCPEVLRGGSRPLCATRTGVCSPCAIHPMEPDIAHQHRARRGAGR